MNTLPVHETATATSGNVTLFYRRFGEQGELPILILHGLSYFSYDWVGAAQALATDRDYRLACESDRWFNLC